MIAHMVLACSKEVERSQWQFLYTEDDAWKAFMDGYPGMTWLATVVYNEKLLGEIHTAWLEDGQFVYVPAWFASSSGCVDAHWNKAELESPEAAAIALLCCEAGRDPAPAVAEERRLRHLTTATLRRELAARDGWVCLLCGDAIPRRSRNADDAGPDPLFPEVEHINPLKSGGPHWWSNLRLVHHACDVARGGRDDPYEPDTRVMLRAWLNDHPKARPCPVDSVDPAHYNGDGTCKCRRGVGDDWRRNHLSETEPGEVRHRSLRELAKV